MMFALFLRFRRRYWSVSWNYREYSKLLKPYGLWHSSDNRWPRLTVLWGRREEGHDGLRFVKSPRAHA